MIASADQDLWQRQGYLIALAEIVRDYDDTVSMHPGTFNMVAELLDGRGLTTAHMIEAGLQPFDVRELQKVNPHRHRSTADILPFQRRGRAGVSQSSSATEDAR